VKPVGIAFGSGSGSKWGRQMVDLGVGAGCLRRVIAQEPVGDAPGGATGEGAGERRRRIASTNHRPMCLAGTGLGAQQEGGAPLSCSGAGRKHGGDTAPRTQPAGGDQRQGAVQHGVDHLEQRKQSDVSG